MTMVFQNSDSDSALRSLCQNCKGEMVLSNVRRRFANNEMTEQQFYRCQTCGEEVTIER